VRAKARLDEGQFTYRLLEDNGVFFLGFLLILRRGSLSVRWAPPINELIKYKGKPVVINLWEGRYQCPAILSRRLYVILT
jgi:hypothetical protein